MKAVANCEWRVLDHRTYWPRRQKPGNSNVQQRQRWLSITIQKEADAIDTISNGVLWAGCPSTIAGSEIVCYVGGQSAAGAPLKIKVNLPGTWIVDDLPVSYDKGVATITWSLSRAFSDWTDMPTEAGD